MNPNSLESFDSLSLSLALVLNLSNVPDIPEKKEKPQKKPKAHRFFQAKEDIQLWDRLKVAKEKNRTMTELANFIVKNGPKKKLRKATSYCNRLKYVTQWLLEDDIEAFRKRVQDSDVPL
jgi:hypothetical protein